MDRSVRATLDSLANSRGRSTRHVLIGLGLTAGAVLASALIARKNAPSEDNPAIYADYEALEQPRLKPPKQVFAIVWPPLFMALILSGLRIWNAPRSAGRTQALGLWGGIQALNALWMALGPKRLGGQLVTAAATIGASFAYLWRARRVDPPAARLVAPYAGWISFAGVLTEELWRKNVAQPTIH